MKRPIKSSDPRKAAIVAALKAAHGATKVTMVVQVGDNTYEGHCMRPLPGRRYRGQTESLGFQQITLSDAEVAK